MTLLPADKSFLAVAGGGVYVVSTETGKVQQAFKFKSVDLHDAAVLPDGKSILIGGADPKGGAAVIMRRAANSSVRKVRMTSSTLTPQSAS